SGLRPCYFPSTWGRGPPGPNGHPVGGQLGLRFPHGVLAEMEDRSREQAGRTALGGALAQVLERAHTAARDQRDADRVADRAQELEVVSRLRAVAVHGRKEDLTRAEIARLD